MNRKTTAPTVTDTLPSREQIEQQAAELAAQIAAYQQQDLQEEQERQLRRTQAEHEFDQQRAANYSRRELDAEVARARAEFDDSLAETALVRTLADWAVALQRRRDAVYEHVSRLNRLGRPTEGVDYPPAELGPVQDVIAAAVQQLVTERVGAERAALAAQRETAITTATETQETR